MDPISSAIREAASVTGVDFGFLFKQAKIESGLNNDAKASSSSASGLFQFTRGTWLKVIADHGASAGLSSEAAALNNGSASPAYEKQILDLRNNPDISAKMAAHYAVDNVNALKAQGIEVKTPTDLYLAHFLGSGGAAKFLTGLKNDPDAPASTALPGAASANKSIFYADGKSKSFADIYQHFSKAFDAEPAATAKSTQIAKAVLTDRAPKVTPTQIAQLVVKVQKPMEQKVPEAEALVQKGYTHLKVQLAKTPLPPQPIAQAQQALQTLQPHHEKMQPRQAVAVAKPGIAESVIAPALTEKPPIALDKLAKFLDGASKWYATPDQPAEHEQKLLVHKNASDQNNADASPTKDNAG